MLSGALTLALCCMLSRAGEVRDSLCRTDAGMPAPEPLAWWYWRDGEVTEASLTQGLEAIRGAGFKAAVIADVASDGSDPEDLGHPTPQYGSEAWTALLVQALDEARLLDLPVGITLQSGMDPGGPSVSPEHVMRRLTFSKFRLKGGRRVAFSFPQPMYYGEDYQDWEVVAFPLDRAGGDSLASGETPVVKARTVRRVSRHLDKTGVFRWRVPSGEWLVLRIGSTCENRQVRQSSRQSRGPLLDPLRADAFDAYAREVLDPVLQAAGNHVGTTLRWLQVGECPLPQDVWTPHFGQAFRRIAGYRLLPWLPAVAGYTVENAGRTRAFLEDWQKVAGTLAERNYLARVARYARSHGLDVRRSLPGQGKPAYSHILLRDFRTVKDGKVINYNIGTAAHGPSTLAALKKYLPDSVRITIWADAPLEPSLSRMMERRFPETEWVFGSLSSSDPDTSALARAVAASDLFLVSSGSGIAVARSLREYRKRTGKPAAAYAIGYSTSQDSLVRDMDFIWFRDVPSLSKAREREVVPSLHGWAPDAVFDFDCVDEAGAEAFMKAGSLVSGQFICCIPGFRYTPRWEYFGTPVDEQRREVNETSKTKDNGILCRIITETVRQRGLKVLICAEQIPELRLCKEAVYDALPDDVRRQCVLQRTWWSPDLALGVYRHSRCVCGIEMHSQVMAAGNGIPAVVLRHSGFGSKSDMWRTIGLGDWLLDIDDPEAGDRACEIVGSILDDPEAAALKLKRARRIVDAAERNAMEQSFFQR